MKQKIELANKADIEKIHKIIYDRCVWFEENNLLGWTLSWYPKHYDVEYFEKQMAENKLYVLKQYDVVCGAMLIKSKDLEFWKDDDKAYYIHHLVTDIKVKGAGKKLMEFAIYKAREDKKEFLRLDCFRDSKFLNSYYEKLGFKNVGHGTVGYYNYNLWEMRV